MVVIHVSLHSTDTGQQTALMTFNYIYPYFKGIGNRKNQLLRPKLHTIQEPAVSSSTAKQLDTICFICLEKQQQQSEDAECYQNLAMQETEVYDMEKNIQHSSLQG